MINIDANTIARLRAQGTPEALEAAHALEVIRKYEDAPWFEKACINIENLEECCNELQPMLEAEDAKTRNLAGRLLTRFEHRLAAATA